MQKTMAVLHELHNIRERLKRTGCDGYNNRTAWFRAIQALLLESKCSTIANSLGALPRSVRNGGNSETADAEHN